MVQEFMADYGSNLAIAIGGVGLAFVCLIGVLWLIRGRNGPSPFVRGGKNRQPRLQVLDAAAVDTRRRLVLVRRDNVEHLIMIGGPTDIVIESGISPNSSAAPTNPSEETYSAAAAAAEPRPVARPAPVAEPRLERPEPPREPVAREIPRPAPAPPVVAARPAPPVVAAPRAEPPVRPRPEIQPEIQPPIQPAIQPTIQIDPPRQTAQMAAPALDDAASVLDAARGRVFVEQPEAPRIALNPTPVPPSLQPAADKPKILGSDFERILEQEMASNLAAREMPRDVPVITPGRQQMPQRDPGVPPVTGATSDPSLQSEVARIFGEMSVTRDK